MMYNNKLFFPDVIKLVIKRYEIICCDHNYQFRHTIYDVVIGYVQCTLFGQITYSVPVPYTYNDQICGEKFQ